MRKGCKMRRKNGNDVLKEHLILTEMTNKGSTQFYLQFCLLSYTILDCLFSQKVLLAKWSN